MFERLTAFLTKTAGDASADQPDERALASLALALAVMQADGIVSDTENAALEALFRDHFGLDAAGFSALRQAASGLDLAAGEQYRHASFLKRHLGEAERIELVSILWSLAAADDGHGEMEDHLVWRIAEMLDVSARDARHLSERKGQPE